MRILARTNSLDAAQANGVTGESVNVSGMRQASVQVGGTFVGEITVEAFAVWRRMV
jgi:hypothetical protein